MTKIMVAVPTGYPKAYALLDLISAFNRMPDKDVEVVFGITTCEDYPEYGKFMDTVRYASKLLKYPYQVLESKLTKTQFHESYGKISRNRQLLRNTFLDGDYDEMLLVGGDNPPHSNVINILSNLGVDCALGLSHQRPSQDQWGVAHPLLYLPIWKPEDVVKAYPDLEPENLRQVELIYKMKTFLQPIWTIKDWDKPDIIYGVVGGDWNGLYTRRVLESVGWVQPNDCGHSEDIHLMMVALSMGFTTAVATHHVVRHVDDDGQEY